MESQSPMLVGENIQYRTISHWHSASSVITEDRHDPYLTFHINGFSYQHSLNHCFLRWGIAIPQVLSIYGKNTATESSKALVSFSPSFRVIRYRLLLTILSPWIRKEEAYSNSTTLSPWIQQETNSNSTTLSPWIQKEETYSNSLNLDNGVTQEKLGSVQLMRWHIQL